MEGRFPNWAARHALFAPWGILAATYALTVYAKAVGWNIWSDRGNLITMSDMADLGIVVYACGASLVEVFIGMAFYALEQRKKRQEQRRREAVRMREEAIREGREEAVRMFSRNLILKANENPQSSVEELVKAVTSEMEKADRN
jgi:hypothetical protein